MFLCFKEISEVFRKHIMYRRRVTASMNINIPTMVRNSNTGYTLSRCLARATSPLPVEMVFPRARLDETLPPKPTLVYIRVESKMVLREELRNDQTNESKESC
jgi:hypothetical protein